MSFSKGQAVKLNEETCFTSGGVLQYPLINGYCDCAGIVYGYRAPTSEELDAWRQSPESKGLDSAGKTKLPPRRVSVTLLRDEVFTVVRPRARMTCVWGNPTPGYALIRREDGEECFVKRVLLAPA